MRYLGNKDSLCKTIKEIILSKVEINENTTFFDAFCGTGTMANAFKSECNIIINDNYIVPQHMLMGALYQNNAILKR